MRVPSLSLYLLAVSQARDLCEHQCTCQDVPDILVTCTGENITTVPAELNPGLHHLSLTFTSISLLGSSHFFDYTALTSLDLSSNSISEVQAGTFSFQGSLLSLNLSGNLVSEVSALSLDGLDSLKHLDLSHNKVHSLQPGLFLALHSLTSLRLQHNLLHSLQPASLSGLSSLLHLSLSSNPLTSLPRASLSLLPSLSSLHLRQTRVRELPDSAFPSLPSLSSLHLGSPSLYSLHPGAFTLLPGLQKLSVINSSLQSASNLSLTHLSSLTHLDLSSNAFLQLGSHWSLPPTLLSLQLSHCPSLSLLHIPPLPLLQNLTITHNPSLQQWETSLLPAKLHLNLSHNLLSSLPHLPPPHLSSLYMVGNPWECDCSLQSWQSALQSLPQSCRDSPQCSTTQSLLTTDLSSCLPPPSHSLALGVAVGVFLLLAALCTLLLLRGRAALLCLARQVRACSRRESGAGWQSSRLPQDDYWLSLARRTQAKPDPRTAVPVTEL